MRSLLLFSMMTVLACGLWAEETARPAKADAAEVNDKAFHEVLKTIAATYKTYGRIDQWMRWGPESCEAPTPLMIRNIAPRISQSGDETTHGSKLYYLYAMDARAYEGRRRSVADPVTPAPSFSGKAVTQAVVKESWKPEPVTDEKDKEPSVAKAGKHYKAGAQGDLFIMLQVDSKTADTDDGWVYGTVSADGKTVTSAGRVQSCMECHVQAPHGRLFGLKEAGKGEKK